MSSNSAFAIGDIPINVFAGSLTDLSVVDESVFVNLFTYRVCPSSVRNRQV